jgi:hypothetical protein
VRATRLLWYWIFWLACLSLGVWWAVAPAGYLAYTWQWLSHLRFEDVWTQDQRAVSDQVMAALEAFADSLDVVHPADFASVAHRSGDPIPSQEWNQLERRYSRRGVAIIDQPSYYSYAPADVRQFTEEILGHRPLALRRLYRDVEAHLRACAVTVCDRQPHVAWVYLLVKDPPMIVHWPGGNQNARYKAGQSPSLDYLPRGSTEWLQGVFQNESFFSAREGDSHGMGDTMATLRSVDINGKAGMVGADVYWEEGPIHSIRMSAVAYSTWAFVSVGALLFSLLGFAIVWIAMLREGTGVCVTIDMKGWSKIDDVKERFKRQRMLDQVIVRAFLASTRQRLVRWSTGDGYHVMFMDHWGARLYRDVLVFACRLLSLWDSRMAGEADARRPPLRVSIGSHGAVTMSRRHGDWVAISDRIVSAVRIDEASKDVRETNDGHRTVAVDQSFRNEMRLATAPEYEALVGAEEGPLERTDKSGRRHVFSMLRLEPLPPPRGWRAVWPISLFAAGRYARRK